MSIKIEITGFNSALPSIYCGNMVGGYLVQVTNAGIRLVSAQTFVVVDEKVFRKNITVATGNLNQLVIALSGGELYYFELRSNEGIQLVEVLHTQLDQDIACLSMRPPVRDTAMMEVDAPLIDQEKSHLLAVGMWTDNTVRLLALPTLQEATRIKLGTETQSRDILISDFQQRTFLFVGMGDGNLITYNIDFSTGMPVLLNRRKGVLGTHPVTFTTFNSSNEVCVFASCDRPTVIYVRNGKLLFSMLDLRGVEVSDMTPFHSELFPDCLALSSDISLIIGTVEDIQKIHVQTVHLEEWPRRISHCSHSGMYLVCTEKTTYSESGEETRARLVFFDEGNFNIIGSFDLESLEVALSLTTCKFEGADKPYFVVGTAQVVNEELEPSRGRILIFETFPDKSFSLLTERDTKAAVHSLAQISGRLAGGIGNKVNNVFIARFLSSGLIYPVFYYF